MKISLSALCKSIGTDRLAARRFFERRDVVPDKEGRVSIADAQVLLQHICETSRDGDARVKAAALLQKLSGPLSEDWANALGLEESDPTIEDTAPEAPETPETPEAPKGKEIEKPAKTENMKTTHLGMAALVSPFTAMIFTSFALLGQAYLFGHLAHNVFTAVGIPAPMRFHFIIAFIFECTGILIAASFNDRKIGGEYDGVSIRGIWLFVFFAVQVVSDLCLFGVIKNPIVGTVIVAVAMPIALLGYANLYMSENRKGNE